MLLSVFLIIIKMKLLVVMILCGLVLAQNNSTSDSVSNPDGNSTSSSVDSSNSNSTSSSSPKSNSVFDIVSVSGYNFDQIIEWSDEIWAAVENGEIRPEDAQSMFKEEVGISVLDFLVGAGRFKIAA